MRKPNDITIDRTLLIYVLHLAESKEFSMVSDVKLQQLVFLAELQMLGKGFRGFHFEFMRYPYGAFMLIGALQFLAALGFGIITFRQTAIQPS